jgi:hypothetical protein
MDHTLEVRWFVPGTPPDAVVDWIGSLGAEAESTRTDLYLVSSDPAMNVKLREGKIQTKHRMGSRSPIAFADGVLGVKERWVKWSFDTDDPSPDLLDRDPTGLWHPVHKERLQLEVPPDAQAAYLNGQAATNATALIELTLVQSRDHTAWTVCMEAEGAPDALPATLKRMGRALFGQGTPPAFARDQSFGYARWLDQLDDTPSSDGAPPT